MRGSTQQTKRVRIGEGRRGRGRRGRRRGRRGGEPLLVKEVNSFGELY